MKQEKYFSNKLTVYSSLIYTLLALLLFVFAHVTTYAQLPLPPIGQWREHVTYQNTIQVVEGADAVYCATTNNVFSVDGSNTINRFSKVTGLNDIGVSAIGWDQTTGQLVIAYNNSNIDVLKGLMVKNVRDVLRSTVTGNKTINYIYCENGIAYLCSEVGIILLNLVRFEIKDTWKIGNNGALVNITGLTSSDTFWYAATAEGTKTAAKNGTDLANFANWSNPVTSLTRMVSNVAGSIAVLINDSVLLMNGQRLYYEAQWRVTSMTSSQNKLLLCQRSANGNSRVLVITPNGNVERIVLQSGVISTPRWAIQQGNAVWVADFFGGLSKFTTAVERFIPNGPPGPANGEMVAANGKLQVAGGEVNDAWNYQFNRNGVFNFSNGLWSSTGGFTTPVLDTVLDFISLATDPINQSLWAGSYGGGLVNFGATNISIYKQSSTLQPAIGDPTSYRVSGLAFDSKNNLWISNYGASQNLQVRKANGTFKAIAIPFFHFENAVSQLLANDDDHLWIVSPRGNGVFVYSYGQSVDNLADDQWRYLRLGRGNGNLPSNNVYCLAKDNDGFIWIGTARGIGIVQCPGTIFNGGDCEAILPVVQQDRFAGLLFQNEEVRTIAVDGANRKWIGTRNGVWLISPDGEKVIYRFTENNSPLLSNDVNRIAIDGQSGEVFISTFKGICSFRSTATQAVSDSNNVLVFPNPVPPGYQGTIAIKGLPENANVKITELSGRLIFETRSLGGQAIWNGRSYKGEKIASGVYLVFVSNGKTPAKPVTKIVITSGR